MLEGSGQFKLMKKFKPMKKNGMRDWLLSMRGAGILSSEKVGQFMADNERKQERLRKYGLPTFTTWGPTESLAETAKLIPDDWKKIPSPHLFLVRCAPKNLQSNLKIERTVNITWPEIEAFVKGLPGGEENYTVEIRENWVADCSGTIIADGRGKIMAEIAEGSLAELEDKGLTEIKKAQIDLGSGDMRFRYSENISPDEQKIFLEALKYFIPNLTREDLEKLKIYTEFCYSKEHGFKFFEATDDDFLIKT